MNAPIKSSTRTQRDRAGIRTVLTLAIALCFSAQAYGANATAPCAHSPYAKGDKVAKLGPPGDKFYNSLHVTSVYVALGKTDAKWCSLGVSGSCGPEPQWYRETAGWIFKADDIGDSRGTVYLWYSNGYEMDEPLNFIDTPLANLVLRQAIRCK